MDGSTTCEANVAKAAALKNCLVYLLQDTKDADMGWCALHLKIAISELNNILEKEPLGGPGGAALTLCGHPATSYEIAE
ncbi:MAG: hypothetical protein IID51_00060 [Proteobacteria bacterium]|nr:hypothetical protein [Pseudomonadota bacterium]